MTGELLLVNDAGPLSGIEAEVFIKALARHAR